MRKFLLIAGAALAVSSTASLAFINFSFGVIILWGISALLVIYGLFFDKALHLKWLNRLIFASCAAAIVMMLLIGVYGQFDNATYAEDAVIVLGAAIRGERVSKPLAYRLDKAAEYSLKNPKAIIVVSGGQGFQEDITEALAMERYLIGKGIPAGQIIKEEQARSTYQNFLYTKPLLDELFGRPYKTVVITNGFHIFRAVSLAKSFGYDITHLHAKLDWYSLPQNYLRECAAIFKMWIELHLVFS